MSARPILGFALVTALAVSGIAAADIPDPDGAIHGCGVGHNGKVRIIDPSTGDTAT